jgi:hypothetical protein
LFFLNQDSLRVLPQLSQPIPKTKDKLKVTPFNQYIFLGVVEVEHNYTAKEYRPGNGNSPNFQCSEFRTGSNCAGMPQDYVWPFAQGIPQVTPCHMSLQIMPGFRGSLL